MNWLRWLALGGLVECWGLACGLIGWTVRGRVEEIRVDRAEREADEAFNREHPGGGA